MSCILGSNHELDRIASMIGHKMIHSYVIAMTVTNFKLVHKDQ